MSEYMLPQPKSNKPTLIDELDNTGTLFDKPHEPVEGLRDRLDDLVDAGVANYAEARKIVQRPGDWEVPSADAVSVTLQQRFQDELDLLDTMSGMVMRTALIENPSHPSISERYHDIDQVTEGAKRNVRFGGRVIDSIYHKDELLRAGFDQQDVEDDIVKMRYNYRKEYSGKENRNKRRSRRKFLKKMLSNYN